MAITMIIINTAVCLLGVLIILRIHIINSFKIGYYERKLKSRNVEISHIENIGLIEILKM